MIIRVVIEVVLIVEAILKLHIRVFYVQGVAIVVGKSDYTIQGILLIFLSTVVSDFIEYL